MNKIENYIAGHSRAFITSIVYVGFGTLSVCSIYPKDLFYGDRSILGLVVTFPVIIFSFGFRFAEGTEPLYPVFIIQFMMLVLTFLILNRLIKEKKV